MGKKVSQSPKKISKNHHQEKKQLAKILRPKVYITHTSNFKKLVQELTGGGGGHDSPVYTPTTSSSSSTPPQSPTIDLIDQHQFDHLELFLADQEMGQFGNFHDQENNLSVAHHSYQDLESWLLDGDYNDPCPATYSYNSYYGQCGQQQQVISINNYEPSGLF